MEHLLRQKGGVLTI